MFEHLKMKIIWKFGFGIWNIDFVTPANGRKGQINEHEKEQKRPKWWHVHFQYSRRIRDKGQGDSPFDHFVHISLQIGRQKSQN